MKPASCVRSLMRPSGARGGPCTGGCAPGPELPTGYPHPRLQREAPRPHFTENSGEPSPNQGLCWAEECVFSRKHGTFSPDDAIFSPEEGIFSPKQGLFSSEEGLFSSGDGIFSPKQGIFSPKKAFFGFCGFRGGRPTDINDTPPQGDSMLVSQPQREKHTEPRSMTMKIRLPLCQWLRLREFSL